MKTFSRVALITTVLFASTIGLATKQDGLCASARQRGLKGPVHIMTVKCSHPKSSDAIVETYEFALNGRLVAKTGPKAFMPDVMIPENRKVTKRNSQGDAEEVFFFLEGDLVRKAQGEYTYDNFGNWTKLVTWQMFTYTWEGGPPEGSWNIQDVCLRDIEYYSLPQSNELRIVVARVREPQQNPGLN